MSLVHTVAWFRRPHRYDLDRRYWPAAASASIDDVTMVGESLTTMALRIGTPCTRVAEAPSSRSDVRDATERRYCAVVVAEVELVVPSALEERSGGGAGVSGARVSGAGVDGAGTGNAGTSGTRVSGAGTGNAGTDGAGVDGAGVSGAGVSGAGTGNAGTDGAGTGNAGTDGAGVDGAGVDGAGTGNAGVSGTRVTIAGIDGASVDGGRASGGGTDGGRLSGQGVSVWLDTELDGCEPIMATMRLIGRRSWEAFAEVSVRPSARRGGLRAWLPTDIRAGDLVAFVVAQPVALQDIRRRACGGEHSL